MTHLRRYLEEHGVLYPEQLAEATRRQQIYGGSLDTVLLELELLDPVTLSELLERACGFPIVPPELLDNGLERPWDQIPEDLQRSRWVEPLSTEGGEVLVGVHPDLPNDLLGQLLRSVGRMRPLVTPECCLEKVAAERHHSVVPQRYAVMCAAYLSAVRRRPSISGVYEVPRDPPTSTTAPPTRTPVPIAPPVGTPQPAGSEVTEPVDLGTVAGTIDVRARPPMDLPAARTGATVVPTTPPPQPAAPFMPAKPGDTAPPSAGPDAPVADAPVAAQTPVADAPVAAQTPVADAPVAAQTPVADAPAADAPAADAPGNTQPPIDTPASAAPADTQTDAPPAVVTPVRDPADIERRLQVSLSALRSARTRDAALEAVATAAMVLSPRVGLFRVRGSELVGLTTPTSALADAGGKTIACSEDSAAATVVAEGVCTGLAEDADLRLATGADADTPCVLRQIAVRGRPIVVVYLDRDGAPLDEHDLEGLTEIASAAGQAFEEILKLRRRSGPSPTPRPDGSTADSLPARPGESWGPAPERIRAAYGGDQDGEDIEPAAIEPPARSRATTADEEHGPGGPPPATLVPETPPLPPSPWRLSPQLAAQALDERAAAETSAPSDAPPTDDEADSADPPPETPETPASGHDEITQIGPAPTAGTAGAASHDSAESAAEATVDAQPDDDPSAHATNEYPAISHSDDDGNIKFRKTQKLLAMGVADPDADSLSRDTVHSAPPPPPLPPPPPSAVEDPSDGQTRHPRSPTIHGLPPPEPRSHPSASGSFRAPVPNLGDDDDDEVTIISLAQPIMPATARGRIELEDEDWMPPDSPLAADSQHEEIDTLIDAVVSGEASPDQLREHGNAAMLRLMAQFPGPLEVLRRDLHSLPPPSAHGPLIRTVIALGATVVPHVIDLFEHPNPDVRFYAAFVFHELRDPRCMRPLAQLGFDDNGDVRVVTMRVLETYRRSEGFEAAATVVRNQLADSSRADQLHAARAAGTLRDIGSIPQLVDQLSGGDRFIQEAALESLCSITGQQHGLKPHRWRAWYEAQGHRHRIEWIIDSLRHRDVPVRRWAADELVRITGHRVPFSPMGDRRAREVAAKAWTTWWDDRGRAMFGG